MTEMKNTLGAEQKINNNTMQLLYIFSLRRITAKRVNYQ